MSVDVEELYFNLNSLLGDICKFLANEENYEKLSPAARKQADELINRSKSQLQEIVRCKLNVSGDSFDGSYVDMERKPEPLTEDENEEIYSSVEEAPTQVTTVPQDQSNPYSDLAAKELDHSVKYGCLAWRCRIIFKFEKMRRIFAGIHNNWLLIYSCEKDSKPLQTLNLNLFKAQPTTKQCKNLPVDFELVSTLPDKKTYYFVAETHKDMLQWMAHINRSHDNINKPNFEKEELVTDDKIEQIIEEEYIDILEDEEEDIYNEVVNINSFRRRGTFEIKPPEIKPPEIKPPELPRRTGGKPNIPLPPVPSEGRNERKPKPFNNGTRPESLNSSSFSEDSEDDIYEPFVSKTQM